ncbi:SpaA [Verticillium alfalfae VaMs.102]|uniref:SpaA n=1 Tax=Verticillium alfalfae (strain VaMs.102 / ATCC MYA-4576 / FGSC 10136) TaxID=526221 RepID=C9SH89_VERA1|nr:SpaA [Verticillium alfalfae VaMs.102]EEY17683.1 SpaA [Verticillium alfalfae VaMs.102]
MADDGFNRGNLVSPPNSGGSNGVMNGGFSSGPRSTGGPSPPPSIGRSSNGTNLYARSESGRSQREEHVEAVLGQHYIALKDYLSGRDGNTSKPLNKAQDKLLRLSAVQFLELSTDVFDELLRRQALARRPPGPNGQGPPPYLTPEQTFHPKRNQARQKLSSLGPPRFRDLATDVYVELERRYPRFAAGDIPRPGSNMSMRVPPSRSGTPLSGMQNGFPPRNQSRMRRPSDASSIRGAMPPQDPYGVPPSPGLPNGDYGRPMQKQFQSNTIVPNKSTMVEEDDDGSPDNDEDRDAFGLDKNGNRTSDKSQRTTETSEADKKMLEEYRNQVKDLTERLDIMEEAVKRKDDELAGVLDGERSRASANNMEKQEWTDLRTNLENQLADAQGLNDSLRQELDRAQGDQVHARNDYDRLRNEHDRIQDDMDRIRDGHANEIRDLRDQLEEMRQKSMNVNVMQASTSSNAPSDPELIQENQQLRQALEEQQQLRNFRASSLGLTIDQDAGKYVREKGFTEENGLVKDVHVTKFQISIDELLQRARADDPEKIIDAMKHVVVSVRRITKDMAESPPHDETVAQEQAKLKGKVSSTANAMITASKNFAASAGISPVSLLDAAASHLVAAVVDLLRTVKIRATPAGELEDDDDGTITPVDSTGFFSPRTNSIQQPISAQDLPPPPPFQGLGANRASVDSSAYSPVSSPRQSADPYGRRPVSRGANGMGNGTGNGMGYMGMNKAQPPAPANNYGGQSDSRYEDLKIYLEDQTAILVQNIQNLVGSIRSDATISQISSEIDGITNVVSKVVAETESTGNGNLTARLATCRDRLLEANDRGIDLSSSGPTNGTGGCGRRLCRPSPSRLRGRPRSLCSGLTDSL